jgi:6-phospho-beta-glucosidase
MSTIVVLGGSSVSTPQFAEALAGWAGGREERTELVLVGRSRDKLETVTAACRRVLEHTLGGNHIDVRWSADLDDGLAGAEVIVNQVRVGGLRARFFDERFPWRLGLPGEETMGPGGFSNAHRTLPVVRSLFERCRANAPGALVINLTNPAGMVHQVAERVVGLDRVITLCDSPVTLGQKAVAAAGADATACQPIYTGMNHFGWLTSLRCGAQDLLPVALGKAEELAAGLGVEPSLLRWLGALTNPYLRYVYYPDRLLAAQEAKGIVRAEELLALEDEALHVYGDSAVDPREVAHKRQAGWYWLCVVPVLAAVLDGRPIVLPAGVSNRGHLPYLPDDVMVEVTARVGDGPPVPLPPDPLPLDSQAHLVRNANYERLAVDALLEGDTDDQIRALALNPLVPSLDVARDAIAIIHEHNAKEEQRT